jgi:multidrug efflux system membrane fusion protein
VKHGPAEGEPTAVESGVSPGERVVVDGLDKLKDGAQIEPIDRSAQAQSPAPRSAKGEGQRRKTGEARGGGEGK